MKPEDTLSLLTKPESFTFSMEAWFFFFFFRAAPVAYGSSPARDLIGAAAAGLHHSHSNRGSEPCLQPPLQLMATLDPWPIEQGQRSNLRPHGYYLDLFLLSHYGNSFTIFKLCFCFFVFFFSYTHIHTYTTQSLEMGSRNRQSTYGYVPSYNKSHKMTGKTFNKQNTLSFQNPQ